MPLNKETKPNQSKKEENINFEKWVIFNGEI